MQTPRTKNANQRSKDSKKEQKEELTMSDKLIR